METTGKSQNFRLLEIASPKDQGRLDNELNSPGLTQDTEDALLSFHKPCPWAAHIDTAQRDHASLCQAKERHYVKRTRTACMTEAQKTSDHFSQTSCQGPQNNASASWSAIPHQACSPHLLRYQPEKRSFSRRSWSSSAAVHTCKNIYPPTGGSTPTWVKSQSHSISRQTSQAQFVLSRAWWHEPLNHLLIAKSTQAAGGTSQP